MNETEWLEFELTYFEVAVQHFNHYATGTPPLSIGGVIIVTVIVKGKLLIDSHGM